MILKAAVAEGINLRRVGDTRIGIALDERTRREHTQGVWRAFGGNMLDRALDNEYRLPENLVRTSDYLTHPIFHMNRAEAEMTRYMRRLADRDLALDRAMIPLGSCTMKLNATAEMMAALLARVRRHPPFRAVRPDRGLYRGDRRHHRQVLCDHRLRCLLDAAELGGAGRVCGAPDHPGVSRQPRRGAPRRLPDPDLGAWHQPGERADGRHEGRRGQVGRERRHRSRRLPRQGGGERRPARGLDDHLSLDARRLRGDGARGLRDHPRAWRAGLSRRRQHERAGRAGAPRRHRLGRQSPEPAQDLLHPARRRRPRHGADRGQGASRAVPARAGPAGRGGSAPPTSARPRFSPSHGPIA